MPELVADRVSYSVDGADLVVGVSLEADAGALTAIIGPNGAGKTTLLELLAGVRSPTAGTVRLAGMTTSEAAPSDLARVRAVLGQHEPVDVPYTARQVVSIGRFPHRRDPANSPDADAAAVDAAMRVTETLAHAHRSFPTLSGGEQARVSLARVLAQQTPIVLLDEPSAALDVAHQERTLRQIRDLAHGDRTVVAVLHDLNAAAAYADVVVLMAAGSVAAVGSPRTVLREGLLSEVYEQRLVVVDHPLRDAPLVLPAE